MNNMNVATWEEKVSLPTYGIGKPDKNPMFFEKRVYQGSSGVVYPNPVTEKIFDEKQDKEYTGLFLENSYLKVMILPELGGRIQMAYDKVKQRHFIYYNQVIKPALVGLTGPWISGGIEFNWPQHHRPSTFEPVDYKLEENADGSKTVWVNEVERMFGTKAMVGFTLHPDKAYIEIKAKLYNRTPLPQTFLWWANPAVKVNDHYQSVFPPDVNAVFDHGKRDVSTFPIATGTYYKVDYSPGTDISMYKNIPVPTSYMAINSDYDFVGGYEHDTQAGLLHVANHYVSPGKKQWTWGHSDFGQAWDRNLTDEDGPYIELMTGMFTDNQPDFSWLMPYEEKSFTQYFLPYRELGIVKNATKDILVSTNVSKGSVSLKIYVTSVKENVTVVLKCAGEELCRETLTLRPEDVLVRDVEIVEGVSEEMIVVSVYAASGKELISYDPGRNRNNEIPEAAKPALPPEEIASAEQLFLTGQHLEQYRHATYSPVPYYEEALRRDPADIRNNNALGLWYLRRGQFVKSEGYFRKAIETSTRRNPNPYDSEPYYNLGLCLKFLERYDDAYGAFYKSVWSNAWKDSGYFSLAQIDLMRGDFETGLEHVSQSLDRNAANSKAYVLKAAMQRKLGQYEAAVLTCSEALRRDGFNLAALFEKANASQLLAKNREADACLAELLVLARDNEQNIITYALDYASAGLYDEAASLLSYAIKEEGTGPMVYYSLGWFFYKSGEIDKAVDAFRKASLASPYLCFPNRLDEIIILRTAMETNPLDSKAPYYLGNLFYDKRQYNEAMSLWRLSSELDPSFATVWRNLGIATFNKAGDQETALQYYERAFELDPSDARVLMELDQLYKRLNRTPEQRLAFLDDNLNVVIERDDLYLERVALYNFIGENQIALSLLTERKFHPWEGGEGKVSGQYVYSLVQMAVGAIYSGSFEKALELLEQAQKYPHNLGEGKLFGAQENDVFYWMGCAFEGLGLEQRATEFYLKATQGLSEPSAAMFYNDQQPDKIFYQGLAWRRLGNEKQAREIFNKLIAYGSQHLADHVKIDYFAVSLPDLLIFEDNLDTRNVIHCSFIKGLGYLGNGDYELARNEFEIALSMDAVHFGSRTHLKMATELLEKAG